MKLKKELLNQITEKILEELQLIAFDRSGEVSHAQKLSAIRLLGKYIGLDNRSKQEKVEKKLPPPVIIVDDMSDFDDDFGNLEMCNDDEVIQNSRGRTPGRPDNHPGVVLNREQRRALEKLQREEKRRQKQRTDSFGEPVLV